MRARGAKAAARTTAPAGSGMRRGVAEPEAVGELARCARAAARVARGENSSSSRPSALQPSADRRPARRAADASRPRRVGLRRRAAASPHRRRRAGAGRVGTRPARPAPPARASASSVPSALHHPQRASRSVGDAEARGRPARVARRGPLAETDQWGVPSGSIALSVRPEAAATKRPCGDQLASS